MNKAIEEIKNIRELDEEILNNPLHCDICNCNCGCHPCKHTNKDDRPYFPSTRN